MPKNDTNMCSFVLWLCDKSLYNIDSDFSFKIIFLSDFDKGLKTEQDDYDQHFVYPLKNLHHFFDILRYSAVFISVQHYLGAN